MAPRLHVHCAWLLEARVTVGERTVIWDNFRQPFRPKREYSGFGPFVFDRTKYEAALAGLAADVSRLPR